MSVQTINLTIMFVMFEGFVVSRLTLVLTFRGSGISLAGWLWPRHMVVTLGQGIWLTSLAKTYGMCYVNEKNGKLSDWGFTPHQQYCSYSQ